MLPQAVLTQLGLHVPISHLKSLITRRSLPIWLNPSTVTVAVSNVPKSETRMHTPAHGGSEAHNELSDSILSSEPNPLGKHRPPPPQSVLSPDELSYP
ncbi:hypothetical protein Tco_1004362 [Tanacetum coccineum]|uniref:Uncharacterized protein n=1 Tax=Tanacetum coccineum TaxID=301880 RepID=A0ABQ5FCU0_9ASTR